MAKINEHDRVLYQEKAKVYLTMAKAMLDAEKKIQPEIKKTSPDAAMKKLGLVDDMLNLASNYIALNGISWAVLKVKNEEALNDARKSLYKAVIYLEELVSDLLDASFSDYEEKLALISSFDPNQRYLLVRKMGLAIELLVNAYGDNSKWRWTFVELEGRFAVTAKNIVDLKSVYVNSSPQSPYYDSTVYHIRLIKKLMIQAADRYRGKYELSTGQISDFKTGISFLAALRRIHIILAENEEAETIKKKHAIWKQKLESDQKKQEEARKR